MRLRQIARFYAQRARLLEPGMVAALDEIEPPAPADERPGRKLAKLLQRDTDGDRPAGRRARRPRQR